jgi:hypothetical protein
MGSSRKASKSIRLSVEERAELSARLPELIGQASFNSEASREALHAYLRLRIPVPPELLTAKNLSDGLSAREIAGSINRFAKSKVYLEISETLIAIRLAAARQLEVSADKKFLSSLSRVITSKLLTLSGEVGSKKPRKHSSKTASKIRVTPLTISSGADLALWIIRTVGERKKQTRGSAHLLAARWVKTIYMLWRSCPGGQGLSYAAKFLRQLRSTVSPSAYASLMEQPEVISFFKDALSSAIEEAPQALLDGRLNDLEAYLSVVRNDENGRSKYLSRLLEVCRNQQGDLLPEAVEWVARQSESDNAKPKSPTAADESQSYALNYLSLCLLSSWDAASEGQAGVQTLKNVRHLARELFKVDLIGTPGEIVRYNHREHDLGSSKVDSPNQVKIARPGVQWSDGIRSRVLVRALVEPVT